MQYGPRVWAFKVEGYCAHTLDLRLSRVKSVARLVYWLKVLWAVSSSFVAARTAKENV